MFWGACQWDEPPSGMQDRITCPRLNAVQFTVLVRNTSHLDMPLQAALSAAQPLQPLQSASQPPACQRAAMHTAKQISNPTSLPGSIPPILHQALRMKSNCRIRRVARHQSATCSLGTCGRLGQPATFVLEFFPCCSRFAGARGQRHSVLLPTSAANHAYDRLWCSVGHGAITLQGAVHPLISKSDHQMNMRS